MEQGYKKIFWGFLVAIFDINLGPVNILPDFIGYFILGSGVYTLYEEVKIKDFNTANLLANFLMCYSLIMAVLNYGISNNSIGVGLDSHLIKQILDMGLSIFINSITLIMAFNIISGTIALYIEKEQIQDANNLEKTQKKYTVIYIIGLTLQAISINISNEYFIGATALYVIIVTIYFAKIVSNIRKTIDAV